MTRRSDHNNYHTGHKAYMVTLKIEEMAPLLGQLVPTTSAAAASASVFAATRRSAETNSTTTSYAPGYRCAECCLSPLGEAMRQAWLTLPQRFPNITVIDSPEEYVIMPEHFHGIIYVMAYMEEHLSDIIKLFKARVAMTYRRLLIEATAPAAASKPTAPIQTAPAAASTPTASIQTAPAAACTKSALRPVGLAKEWLQAYKALPAEQQTASRQWVEGQLELLFAATRRSKEEQRRLQEALDPSPIRVVSTGSHSKTGFLFAPSFTDSILLEDDNLLGHRLYILYNPHSRWQRTHNPDCLKANRNGIDTAVTIPALEGYLRRECPPRDVSTEKLAAIRSLLLRSATSGKIECHSYGDRALLERRLLPVVCHRKDAPLHAHQMTRCLEAAASGAVMVSAAISIKEREIIEAVIAAGHPVIRIEDNGFPTLYHPSQTRIDLCATQRLLILTPWQYHYRHKDEAIYVAYCKTMNCIAQALCRQNDSWWKETQTRPS